MMRKRCEVTSSCLVKKEHALSILAKRTHRFFSDMSRRLMLTIKRFLAVSRKVVWLGFSNPKTDVRCSGYVSIAKEIWMTDRFWLEDPLCTWIKDGAIGFDARDFGGDSVLARL